MNTFTKAILAIAGLGLLSNVFLTPGSSDSQASATPEPWVPSATSRVPAGYEEGLAERAKQAATELTQAQPTPSASASAISRVARCFEANNCALHMVGIGTFEPYLQLAVIESEASKWAAPEWQAAVEHAKARGRWARANPREAMLQYDTTPETAPFFPSAVSNISKRLDRVSVGAVAARRTLAPRKGVLGWTATNDPSRNLLPL